MTPRELPTQSARAARGRSRRARRATTTSSGAEQAPGADRGRRSAAALGRGAAGRRRRCWRSGIGSISGRGSVRRSWPHRSWPPTCSLTGSNEAAGRAAHTRQPRPCCRPSPLEPAPAARGDPAPGRPGSGCGRSPSESLERCRRRSPSGYVYEAPARGAAPADARGARAPSAYRLSSRTGLAPDIDAPGRRLPPGRSRARNRAPRAADAPAARPAAVAKRMNRCPRRSGAGAARARAARTAGPPRRRSARARDGHAGDGAARPAHRPGARAGSSRVRARPSSRAACSPRSGSSCCCSRW